ncbi:MAG TPA: AbrB/MazE/SpoVT family DNA-binding domain-containing protein [Allosphingosinicella sp.]
MKVAKWGNSLAIRIPKDVAEALDLREGSEIEVVPVLDSLGVAKAMTREEAVQRIRALAKPLPPGWKFDREEANSR